MTDNLIRAKVIVRLDFDEDCRGVAGMYRHRPVWAEWTFATYADATAKLAEINDTDAKWAGTDPAIRGHRGPMLPIGNQQLYFLDGNNNKNRCINTDPWKTRLAGLEDLLVPKTRIRYAGVAISPFTFPWTF